MVRRWRLSENTPRRAVQDFVDLVCAIRAYDNAAALVVSIYTALTLLERVPEIFRVRMNENAIMHSWPIPYTIRPSSSHQLLAE